jgi:8-oxo-dGTP diphosphatase
MTSQDPRQTPRDEDRAFLADYDASRFPRPSVAVDVALVTVLGGALRALLVRRNEPPQAGRWALPGGFVRLEESLDEAAARVLAEKAGVEGVFLEQLYTFGALGRDPRTRVISVAYYALVDGARLADLGNGGRTLAELHVSWPGETGGPVDARRAGKDPLTLGFDHADVLGLVVKRLRGKLDYAPIGFELLPQRFTLRALQEIHEAIRGKTVNKDSFRRRMLASGLLEATGAREEAVGHRPAELFRFARRGERRDR